MAKKHNEAESAEFTKLLEQSKVVKVNVEEEMKKSFIAYAMAVNVSRAIPDVRDGLKPVHRRILYSMSELNLYNEKPYRKCARIVGDVLGKYHPHGDTAVYDSLVRLAQDFSIRHPLVQGHGNFGSVDGDPPAAQRYTEARLSKISGEMLRDIEKETVDYYPNFDDTLMQPTVMPSRFPSLLVNGSDGIAVGMATNIPPHNLGEVIGGVIAQIDNPDITVDELMQFIQAPDYPTGGILMGRAAVRYAYKTGRGGVIIRAKTDIEEETNAQGQITRSRIVITEIPYQVNKSRLIETMAELVKEKKIEGISEIREESDRTGLRIVVEVKRDAQAQVVLNALYKHTQLQVSNGITLLALVNGEPKVLNLKEIIHHYIQHQREIVVRRTKFDLEKAEERHHIVEGLVIALNNIDKVIKIIKSSRDKFEAAEQLINNFVLTEKQANATLEMRLHRLPSLEAENLKKELKELADTIAYLKSILASSQKVLDIVKTELKEIKEKYDDGRKTELSLDYGEIDIADLIEKEDVVISMTHFGYIKRLPTTEYSSQKRGGKGAIAHKPKEQDFVEQMFTSSTHDDLMFFTNHGKVYAIKAYEVPEAQRQARGRAIVNLLQLKEGEKVQAVIPMPEGSRGNLMMATKNGLVKKTNLKEFDSIRKVGKIAINLLDGDELIAVRHTSGHDEILMASHEGKCIRFGEEDVRAMGRDTQGVRSMKLDSDDYIVDMTAVKNGYYILTISDQGYGKRSDIEDYRLQSRAGKGIKAGVFNEKTGKLVNLKQVNDEEDVMVIADNGIIIRIKSKEISKIGRDTMGVRIMRLKGVGNVVSVAITPNEAEDILDE
jgi:DNA gyrase subunit A